MAYSRSTLAGADRYATAVDVAQQFFPHATSAGLVTGLGYAGAQSAGAALRLPDEPWLLTDPTAVTAANATYAPAGSSQLHHLGGTAAVAFDPTQARSGPPQRRSVVIAPRPEHGATPPPGWPPQALVVALPTVKACTA